MLQAWQPTVADACRWLATNYPISMTDTTQPTSPHDPAHRHSIPRAFGLRNPRTLVFLGFFFALGVVILMILAWLSCQVATAFAAVCAPFLAGTFIALILDPVVVWLERRGLTRTGAMIGVFAALVVLMGLFAAFIVPTLIGEAMQLSGIAPREVDVFLRTHRKIGPIHLPGTFNALAAQTVNLASNAIAGSGQGLQALLLGSLTTVVEAVVTLIVAFYILIDVDHLRARIYFLTPRANRWALRQYAGDIGDVFSKYVRGLVTVCFFYGVATVVMLYALSLVHHGLAQYALLVGLLAGILYSIPYLGAVSIAILTMIVAYANGNLAFAMIALALTVLINQIFDNIVTPKVVGGGVGLHPVVALLALAMGGELFHIWGLLLAVPVAASIQIVLYRLYPRLRSPTPTRFLSTTRHATMRKPPTSKI